MMSKGATGNETRNLQAASSDKGKHDTFVLEIRYVSVGYSFIKMSNKVNKVTKVMATCLLNYQNTL